jgi:8-oxo-dGTP pyrophosphatase MutT (NUDIX family)
MRIFGGRSSYVKRCLGLASEEEPGELSATISGSLCASFQPIDVISQSFLEQLVLEDRERPRPWQVLSTSITYGDEWITLRSDKVRLPNGHELGTYHTIEGPDWASIVPITDGGRIVLTEEYRHGARKTLLQLPGGHIEEGEGALAAGRRELLEETGFTGGTWYELGTIFAASARLTSVVHLYLALGVKAQGRPRRDVGEDIRVCTMPWSKFSREMVHGQIDLSDTCDLATLMRLQLFASRSSDAAIAKLKF